MGLMHKSPESKNSSIWFEPILKGGIVKMAADTLLGALDDAVSMASNVVKGLGNVAEAGFDKVSSVSLGSFSGEQVLTEVSQKCGRNANTVYIPDNSPFACNHNDIQAPTFAGVAQVVQRGGAGGGMSAK